MDTATLRFVERGSARLSSKVLCRSITSEWFASARPSFLSSHLDVAADVNARISADDPREEYRSQTPLHLAAKARNYDICEVLSLVYALSSLTQSRSFRASTTQELVLISGIPEGVCLLMKAFAGSSFVVALWMGSNYLLFRSQPLRVRALSCSPFLKV